MKSIRVLGAALIFCLLTTQAFAVVLNFEGASDLSDYGADNGVRFYGWDLVPISGNTKLLAMDFDDEQVVAGFDFFSFDVLQSGFTFQYSLTTGGEATLEAFGVNGVSLGSSDLSIGKDLWFEIPGTWTQALMKSIVFTLDAGALKVDNVTFTPTPLPGAAILLFSGLLGLVGLRRRELV